jgi:glycosyltransferase involved in cell wall biosynthesis
MTSLQEFGAQRVMLNLLKHFDRKKIDPILVLCTKKGGLAPFLDRDEVIYETDQGLPWPRFVFRLPRYVKLLRTLQPEVILSFVPGTNISAALIRPFIPGTIRFIACEHAFITRAFEAGEYQGPFRLLYKLLMRWTYNHVADRLVMPAEVAKRDAVDNWGIKEKQIRVIYNPQDIADLNSRSQEPLEGDGFFGSCPVIVGAGRLTKQKGFERLIEAFSILVKTTPAKLAILGRGDLEGELKRQVSHLGLDAFVRFYGFQPNPHKYIKSATLFVLSSVWEAMPMVLAEAMAIGTPIVAFDCPSGPYEMLEGGKCGFLVKDQDVTCLAETMKHAIMNPEQAWHLAESARLSVQRFEAGAIIRQYQDLIREVVRSRQAPRAGVAGE